MTQCTTKSMDGEMTAGTGPVLHKPTATMSNSIKPFRDNANATIRDIMVYLP